MRDLEAAAVSTMRHEDGDFEPRLAASCSARPIVLLDVDGPLADFTSGFLRALHSETGLRHHAHEVDRWKIADCDFFHAAAKTVGVTSKKLEDRVNAHVSKQGFCANLDVQAGAYAAVERLKEMADVYVLTSPWDSSTFWMYERHQWCMREFGLSRGRILQAATKDLVYGDVFVDDKSSHVLDWHRRWQASNAFLFDMLHNRTADLAPHVVNDLCSRASWGAIIRTVEHRAGIA